MVVQRAVLKVGWTVDVKARTLDDSMVALWAVKRVEKMAER